jgi:N-terminal domain of reverse transcriptase
MLVIAPTNRHKLTHWSQINWTAVEANVRHLQGRIYRAAAHEDHAQVKNRQRLVVRSMSAKLKAIRQVTQEHSGQQTLGIDGVVCDTPQKRLALLEAVQKPFHTVASRLSSLLAVMKRRTTTGRKSVQHQMYMTDLDHCRTRFCTAFIILAVPAIPAMPGVGAFNHPAFL